MMFTVWWSVSAIGEIGLLSVGTIVLMAVRKRIRDRDQIATGSCGPQEDCCCSFWCSCCVTIQAFNHLNMRCETGYQLCSPEGVPASVAPAV